MSINNFTEVQGFSISGLQNITADTINGNTVLTAITIAGQTAFLSYDSTTSTLTLLIPTSNGVVSVGLLSATDWITFNGKESPLTFTSPLTRGGIGGNTISFDFTQSLTFDGNTQTLNNNTYVAGSLFFTGATSAITPDILYIDNFTGEISKGAVPSSTNLLPLDNVWTGATNTFDNTVFIKNNHAGPYPLIVYRDNSTYLDYTYMNNAGKMGFYDGTDKWTIDRFGQYVGSSIIVNDFIQATNNIETTNGYLGGAGLTINPTTIGNVVRINASNNSNDYLFYDNTNYLSNQTTFGFYNGFGNSWSIESEPLFESTLNISKIVASKSVSVGANGISTTGPFLGTSMSMNGNCNIERLQTINTTVANLFRFTHIEPSPAINIWISAEFSYDAIDKPVIGNLGLATGGYGACVGGHNTSLSAWTDFWVNPGATTYTGALNATAFNYPSDRRIKKEISYLDASKSIKFVKGLKPARFKKCVDDRIEFLKNEGEKFELGFIAQDIQEIAETESQKMIITTETYLEKERLTIKPFYILAELVNANKEMIDKIERLETENKLLLERINAMTNMEERLLKIENLIVKKKCLAFI